MPIPPRQQFWTRTTWAQQKVDPTRATSLTQICSAGNKINGASTYVWCLSLIFKVIPFRQSLSMNQTECPAFYSHLFAAVFLTLSKLFLFRVPFVLSCDISFKKFQSARPFTHSCWYLPRSGPLCLPHHHTGSYCTLFLSLSLSAYI